VILIGLVILLVNGRDIGAVMLVPALVYPLLWLGVALEESFYDALNPSKAWRLLRGLGPLYPAVALPLSFSIGYMIYSIVWATGIVHIALSALLFLLAHCWTGLVLYWRRGELELETSSSPEQDRAKEIEAESRALDQAIHEMQTHLQNGNTTTAIRRLHLIIGKEAETLDPMVHERLFQLADNRLGLEHALGYLQRMLNRGEERKAWALMKRCLAVEERFRPVKDATLLALTRSAGREDAGIVNDLLAGFAEAYPESDLIPEARFRQARVCIELLGDADRGVGLLDTIARDYPAFAATEAYLHYQSRLKIQS
jgi:hypothetical protein